MNEILMIWFQLKSPRRRYFRICTICLFNRKGKRMGYSSKELDREDNSWSLDEYCGLMHKFHSLRNLMGRQLPGDAQVTWCFETPWA